ncbi:hypothetical protein IF2G_03965 [Cordyceps javanica]|nr:hypothetical protein IF2G_03965 [Cordyceps javanica]
MDAAYQRQVVAEGHAVWVCENTYSAGRKSLPDDEYAHRANGSAAHSFMHSKYASPPYVQDVSLESGGGDNCPNVSEVHGVDWLSGASGT